jgi:hypothetical protein
LDRGDGNGTADASLGDLAADTLATVMVAVPTTATNEIVMGKDSGGNKQGDDNYKKLFHFFLLGKKVCGMPPSGMIERR